MLDWTEPKIVRRIGELLNEERSRSQIAAILSKEEKTPVTRAMVCGQLHRHTLYTALVDTFGKHEIDAIFERISAKRGRTPKKRDVLLPAPSTPRVNTVFPIEAVPKRSRGRPPGSKNKPKAPVEMPMPPVATPLPERERVPALTAVLDRNIDDTVKAVLEITDFRCHWPIGMPRAPGFHFCARVVRNGPYCVVHQEVSAGRLSAAEAAIRLAASV